jgi:small subunit ribosomal protein S19
MSRSRWKGPYIKSCVLKQEKVNQKIWSRASTIPNCLVGTIVSVYNGCEFKRIIITRKRIGFKFGEFSLTRKFRIKKKITKIKLIKTVPKKK